MTFKRVVSILLISLLMMQVVVFAEPSNWAVEFIENATTDNLIPESLKSDYQKNIKRYEYVLLALRVLEQNNIEVMINDAEPFTDIANHPLKTEIIKAFNAGIIKGYDDKTFKPDNEISREEVSSLVYNLVKTINTSTMLPTTESTFSDTDKISKWAKPYIEFNYKKAIITGTGKVGGLDTMNPQGKTTREQAITLLYRVSIDKNLLAKFDMNDHTNTIGTISGKTLDQLAAQIGSEKVETLIGLEGKINAEIVYVSPNLVAYQFPDKSILSFRDNQYETDIKIKTADASSMTVIDAFVALNEITLQLSDLKPKVIESLSIIKSDKTKYIDYSSFGKGLYSYQVDEPENNFYLYVVSFRIDK